MRLTAVALSDTHNHGYALEKLPKADMLIHAGDSCLYGGFDEYANFVNWLVAASHKYTWVIYIPGNHDKIFDGGIDEGVARALTAKYPNIIILTNGEFRIDDFTIYGCSYTLPIGRPWHYYKTEDFMASIYEPLAARYPQGFDLLVTHDPPYRIADKVNNNWHHWPFVGSKALRQYVEDTQPAAHVFGHIHEGYGRYEGARLGVIGRDGGLIRTVFFNAAHRDEGYNKVNSPWYLVFDKIEDRWELTDSKATVEL